MTADELQERTFRFAVDVVRFCRLLPDDNVGYVVGRQLIKSGTSVGANYRADRRSRSRAESASRISIVLEEADESHYRLTLIVSADWLEQAKAAALVDEAGQLRAIFSRTLASVRDS